MHSCTERSRLLKRVATALLLPATTALLLAGCASTPKTTPTETTSPALASVPAAQAQAQFDAALKLMKEHQDEPAIAAFQQLTQSVPNASGPFTNLGILYARSQHWSAAAEALNQAVKINPKNAEAYNWLGIAQRHLGAYPQALAAYQKALAAQPENADAHFNLAILYDLYLHVPQQAIAQYSAYQKTAGHDTPIVSAWIKGLQAEAPASTASPAAPNATEHKP